MNNIVLISALALALTSLLGSAAGLLIKNISHRANDVLLGFCAGMMLSAALVCLIMPAVEMCTSGAVWQVPAGVAAGVALIGVLDYFTPHIHNLSGLDMEAHAHNKSVNRIFLFVMAVAIHKFPEGLATGVAAEGVSAGNAMAITVAIALQNIPEGMVVVVPLLMIGVRTWRVMIISLCVAAIEVAGVFTGYLLGDISSVIMPLMLALAGGAMLYVISDEMIPETHAHGHQKQATYALITGSLFMLFIDKYF